MSTEQYDDLHHDQAPVAAPLPFATPGTPVSLGSRSTEVRRTAQAKNERVGTEEMGKKTTLISLRMRPNTGEPSHTSSKTPANTARRSLPGRLAADDLSSSWVGQGDS